MKSSAFEMFPQGIPGIVVKPIAILQPGQIKFQGQYWRAQLHEFSCHATLLPDQPVLAVGRENITLIVIPMHCILLEQE